MARVLPPQCGIHFENGKGEFTVAVSPNATAVELHLLGPAGAPDLARQVVRLTHDVGSIWAASLPGLLAGERYGVKVFGEGLDSTRLLVDPRAQAIYGDGSDGTPLSVVVDSQFDWGSSANPQVDWSDTVIYEAHVKGATKQHPDIDPTERGTYSALGHPAFISHLTDLGVTALELLPIHHRASEPRLESLGLSNYWGYNTLGFFAPDQRFASANPSEAQGYGSPAVVDQLKGAIKRLHQAGIEVILDVVYNHTCEAGPDGPVYSWRGFDPYGWYRNNDTTGCGNSLDLTQPNALALVMDSLRHWINEYQIDGFRFDLASTLARTQSGEFSQRSPFLLAVASDPLISSVKLIAEPWDVGPGGYQVGSFPAPWAEWNDRYRDLVRDHWRGVAPLGALANRLSGGPDLFQASKRRPWASINFVTCHDGFTMNDLVSFNDKHNEANGEKNADGTSNNRSYNHGVEGETENQDILSARKQTVRAMLATLLLSQGTPMLCGGDEFGRTQRGNNNAYCQDNDISWLNWDSCDKSLFDFTRELISLRQRHRSLRRNDWLTPETARWYSPDGEAMVRDRWDDPSAKGLALVIVGADLDEADICILINDTQEQMRFVMPKVERSSEATGVWKVLICSHPELGAEAGFVDAAALLEPLGAQADSGAVVGRAVEVVTVPNRCVVVLEAARSLDEFADSFQ